MKNPFKEITVGDDGKPNMLNVLLEYNEDSRTKGKIVEHRGRFIAILIDEDNPNKRQVVNSSAMVRDEVIAELIKGAVSIG